MNKTFCLALILVVSAWAWSPTRASFDEWMEKMGKASDGYSNDLLERKFEVWKDNLAYVEAHNERFARSETKFSLGMNRFADLENTEYRQLYLGRRVSNANAVPVEMFTGSSLAVPAEWNWVAEGIVPTIKDQGLCGSCWAFSAVAAMEGAYNHHANGTFPDACADECGPNNNTCCSFSEQEVADCTLGGKDTCDLGGEPRDGVADVAKRGSINTEEQYPYTSGDTGELSKCKPQKSAIAPKIKGFGVVTIGDEAALVDAIYEKSVISVGIDASQRSFQLYDSGVYDEPACLNKPDELDHGVSITGYGSGEPGPPGPVPPSPYGPKDCMEKSVEAKCLGEEGCFWCPTKFSGYCFNRECPPSLKGGKEAEWYMVRNSWGSEWGMGGYIAMSRNKDNQCGIATDAIYAVVE